jgi:hypothetical protein
LKIRESNIKFTDKISLSFNKNTKEEPEDPQHSEKTTFVILNGKLGNKLMRLKIKIKSTMPKRKKMMNHESICLLIKSIFHRNKSLKFQTNGSSMSTGRGGGGYAGTEPLSEILIK